MNLRYTKRTTDKKSQITTIRLSDDIPAVIYKRGGDSETITVKGADFQAVLREVTKGHLSTTVLKLADESGKERRGIVKDIQYHKTTYRVLHLDFEELIDNMPLHVKVPIELTNTVDCVGIKQGGLIRQVIRSIKVHCLPKDLPSQFQFDMRELGLGQVRRLSDIPLAAGVRMIGNPREIVVAVGKSAAA